jgi:hypothetical protein
MATISASERDDAATTTMNMASYEAAADLGREGEVFVGDAALVVSTAPRAPCGSGCRGHGDSLRASRRCDECDRRK